MSSYAVLGSDDHAEPFAVFSRQYRDRLEKLILEDLQSLPKAAPQLLEAMIYSVSGGGKRIRALLAYAAAPLFGEANSLTDQAALALEYIHAYSLIHDDLPAMDDDDLRRGKPSCHKAFDEATAILAGDALQARSFELLSRGSDFPTQRLAMMRSLAEAAGARGMVGGQSIDLNSVDTQLSLDQLKQMHALKTGALIKASVQLGAISSADVSLTELQSLNEFADAIGLAFQIQDDILDVTADTQTLGKPQGADVALNKPTFVSFMGLEGAKQEAQIQYDKALHSLIAFGEEADHLRAIAQLIVKRGH